MTVARGGGKQNQLFIIKCFRGWALVFAGEAGFPALRRLNNTENREQRTADRLVLEMLLFKIVALSLLEIFRNSYCKYS